MSRMKTATSAALHPAASMMVSIRVISAWPRGRSRTRWLRISAPSEASRTPAAAPRIRYPHARRTSRRTWRARSCGLLFSFGLQIGFGEAIAAGAQRRMLALGVEQGVEHLRRPALRAKQDVVLQADLGRIFACDMRGAEQHVPEEQQVAEVALIVADAIFVGERVVRPVRGRRGD